MLNEGLAGSGDQTSEENHPPNGSQARDDRHAQSCDRMADDKDVWAVWVGWVRYSIDGICCDTSPFVSAGGVVVDR